MKCLLIGVFLTALIGLINIGSSTVFNDVISLVLVSLYGTYILACGTLLYRRVSGDIGDEQVTDEKRLYTWGPFRLKGPLGVIVNVCSLLYLVLLGFFSFWPAKAQVTAENMNYSSLLLGATVIFSMVYYIFWAHRTYSGPIVEVRPSLQQF